MILARHRVLQLVCWGAATLVPGCGSLVDVPARDMDTPPYLDVVYRVPSFWATEPGDTDGLTVFYYVRDDSFPPGTSADVLRETILAAVKTWGEALEEGGRDVHLPVLFASQSPEPPGPHASVAFVWRGPGWLGRTIYLDEGVRVEVSTRALSIERFLTRRELLALCVHEVGHSLGISSGAPGTTESTGSPGHSPNPNDVMFGHNLDNTWITLSAGDRQTILSLFPR